MDLRSTPHSKVLFFPTVNPAPSRLASVRVALIDPNRTKIELLGYFCTMYWGFEVVVSEISGRDGIAAIATALPELILAVLTPSDIGLVEYVNQLRAAAPNAKLVLLATECNEYIVYALGRTEYHGLVWEAEMNLGMLGLIIERVRNGFHAVSPTIQRFQNSLRTSPDAFPKLLSRRHMEVLICIAHCMSDEQIAKTFKFSVGTALSHRQKIMRKLNIHKTPKLIRYCHDKGFDSVPPFPVKEAASAS